MTVAARIEAEPAKKHYATKAKVEHAVRMAKLAGISTVGAIEFGPDGTIRIVAASLGSMSAEDEAARWRIGRGK